MPYRRGKHVRDYHIVWDYSPVNMKDREQYIRSVSITSSREFETPYRRNNDGYILEVTKSPRSPEYAISYVKNAQGIKMVKGAHRPVWKPPDWSKRRAIKGGKSRETDEDLEDGKHVDTDGSQTDRRTDRSEKMPGLRVLAQHRNDGLYYAGSVKKTVTDSMYALVTFDFGKREKVSTRGIIPMSGAIPMPELMPGDFVLVKVAGREKRTCYVPAIIEVKPEDPRTHVKCYSVLMYNGQRAVSHRRELMKIGPDRFKKAVGYIAQLQQKHLNRQDAMSESTVPTRRTHSDRSLGSDGNLSTDASSRGSSHSSRSSRSRNKKKKQKLTQKLSEKHSDTHHKERRRKSRSRSNSGSSKSSKGTSRSSTSSRSNASSRSRSSRSGSSTPRQRSPRQRSSQPSPIERPGNPVPGPRPNSPHPRSDSYAGVALTQEYTEHLSRCADVDERSEIIRQLQDQLEKQKRKQFRQERRLVRQARKINKIRGQMREGDNSHNNSRQSDRSDKTERSDKTRSHHTSESETESSPQRRKGSPDGTSYRESTDFLVSSQRALPGLRQNQEVLARWSDDGWYYRGCVVTEHEQKYFVVDATGYMEQIHRDDILTENQHNFDAIQPQDFVIALHPSYVFSYAPAEVLGVFSNRSAEVEFYDGTTAKLTADQVYKISKVKYDEVLDDIKMKEKLQLEKNVVAREDSTGLYKNGVVYSLGKNIDRGQQYYIRFYDDQRDELHVQNANHIFELSQREMSHADWQYALAPTTRNNQQFKPVKVAVVDHKTRLTLSYYDHDIGRTIEVEADQCFWLNRDYYKNAVEYYHHANRA